MHKFVEILRLHQATAELVMVSMATQLQETYIFFLCIFGKVQNHLTTEEKLYSCKQSGHSDSIPNKVNNDFGKQTFSISPISNYKSTTIS